MEPELVKEGFTEHTYHLAPKWTSVEERGDELTADQQRIKRMEEAGNKLKVVVETCRYNARQGAGVDETASFPFFDAPLESWQQALGGDE
jgi:hypothetical protein